MAYNTKSFRKNCSISNKTVCDCEFNVNVIGLCDPSKIAFSKIGDPNYKKDYNWTEMSIPEILNVPCQKPDIEHIDQVMVDIELTCIQLIETPKLLEIITDPSIGDIYTVDGDGFNIPLPNEEGTYLTGRKLIVEGILKQKVVYTADVGCQSVHSAHFEIPFSSFIIVYPKFTNPNIDGTVDVDTAIVDTNEEFCVDVCVEDVFIKALDPRTIFKNVTLFLRARPIPPC